MRDITLLPVAVWAVDAHPSCVRRQETRIYQSVKRLVVSEFRREGESMEEVENGANSQASRKENTPILRLDALRVTTQQSLS